MLRPASLLWEEALFLHFFHEFNPKGLWFLTRLARSMDRVGRLTFTLLLIGGTFPLGAHALAAVSLSFPVGDITVHKFPQGSTWGGQVMTDMPTILFLPFGWTCYKTVNTANAPVTTPAAELDPLETTGDYVECTPPADTLPTACRAVTAYGYAATVVASNAQITVESDCGSVQASAQFGPTPPSDSGSDTGLDFFPWRCTVEWTAWDTNDDWWINCHVN